MKKFLLFLIFSAYSLYANTVQPPAGSIAEIYNRVQKSNTSDLEYPIYHHTLKKSKWASITTAWDTFIKATVDNKNNYIFINDEGTGGGSFATQAALWKYRSGAFLLIVSENGFDPQFFEPSVLKAYQYFPKSGKRASPAIKRISPPLKKLSLRDFMPKIMSKKDLRILKQIKPSIFYKLPRKGTTIHALLIVRDEYQDGSILKDCYYDEKTCKKKKSLYRYYHKRLKGKIYRNIELAWDGYQFKIKQKSRKKPTFKDIFPEL